MISVKAKKSEEATNNENNGIETDPILDKIAKSRGINLQKLLKTLKCHPDELTEEEQVSIINYSSAVLPKKIERKMIEMYRENRDKLNELLFNHNTRIATRLATIYNAKYARTALNRRYAKEDFLSAARYGLWMGAKRFDIDRKYKGEPIKFVTFATPWVFRYISEMLYEKENMIIHHSLEDKAFGDPDSSITLGDIISDSQDDEAESYQDEADDTEGSNDDIQQLSDDEENLGFDTQLSQETILQSIEGSLETVVEAEHSDDGESAKVEATMHGLKELVRPKHGDEERDLRRISSGLVGALDTFCTKALSIYDKTERTITLFVGKRYIQTLMRSLEGVELPKSITDAAKLLEGLPKSKKKLLADLSITEAEFNRLCRHYAVQYGNREQSA